MSESADVVAVVIKYALNQPRTVDIVELGEHTDILTPPRDSSVRVHVVERAAVSDILAGEGVSQELVR